MLTEKDKKWLYGVYEQIQLGDVMATMSVIFMTFEQRDYIASLVAEAKKKGEL